jgi:hypothetical protein
LREVLKKLIALALFQRADRFFDLLRCAHSWTLAFDVTARNEMNAKQRSWN